MRSSLLEWLLEKMDNIDFLNDFFFLNCEHCSLFYKTK